MIGPDEVERAILDHADHHVVRPDIFADQRAGASVLIISIFRASLGSRRSTDGRTRRFAFEISAETTIRPAKGWPRNSAARLSPTT